MAVAKLDPKSARRHLQKFQFADLFIEDLGWNHPGKTRALALEVENTSYTATEISELSGFRVFEITPADSATPFPSTKEQQLLSKKIAELTAESIIIFLDNERRRSLWLWNKREGKRTIPRRHHYLAGQPGDLFLTKLSALVVDLSELDEDGNFSITETARRVRDGLDIEKVTKDFFREFQDEHGKLLEAIEGIDDPRDRRWYASVLLNRLMFIWFLQKKSFLPGDELTYLADKLAESQAHQKDQFFSHFLRDLFFEGFARTQERRTPIGTIPLGDIPYLNGGLFLPHGIEECIEGEALFAGPYQNIKIADPFFVDLFALFKKYTWSLNDTPGGDDREINPDVLGYIFEKYINNKEFGAYYTRPEITDYLCEQTIHQLVLEKVNKRYPGDKKLHESDPKGFPKPRKFSDIQDLLLHAEGHICQSVLQDILPSLSLLDPACGSGAFLVAAQKTLLNLYTGLIGRSEALNVRPVLQWIEFEKTQHKAPVAYWLKKKIVTENLYGVDLMEEATEIAKLRLFLSLVASAEDRDQLEPLPNIEFNLLAGNSLIGLLHVDSAAFDSKNDTPKKRQSAAQQARMSLAYEEALGFTTETTPVPTNKEKAQAHVTTKQRARYDELLRKKNERIDLYKKSTSIFKDLAELRHDIEVLKQEAQAILNKLLLEQFQALGIEYHQATWDAAKGKEGKPDKRPLTIADIEALTPFHWAYEFDKIIVEGGGFDAIITNPPWDIFKPNAKEFFEQFDAEVTRNKMRLEDFQKQKKTILADNFSIKKAWLNYLSSFPHQSLYFRGSSQYTNQVGKVNGRNVGSDINLYKLFLEQCTHLLKPKARCGIVIPSGIYTDLGATQLRKMLFHQARITGLFGFENRKVIFEGVHRSFKFVVLSFENSGQTGSFPARFMRRDVEELANFPAADSLSLEPILIEKLSPGSLSMMEFQTAFDVTIAKKLLNHPMLGDEIEDLWNVSFATEFHMTNDASVFLTSPEAGAFPLYEGKMIWQFEHGYAAPRYWVHEEEGRNQVLGKTEDQNQKLDYQRYRLGFRDIAANTNERTLISTVLPIKIFVGNTLPYLKRPLSIPKIIFLAAAFNSFTADWLIRKKITTHCNFFYMKQLPIPRLDESHPTFNPITERCARLIGTAAEFDELIKEVFGKSATHQTHGVTDPQDRLTLRAELDALIAQLYELTIEEFQHILSTFPLVDESVKSQTLNAYRNLIKLGSFPRSTAPSNS